MSMTTSVARSLPVPSRDAPPGAGALAWLKTNLFATWISTAVTLALGYVIVRIVLALHRLGAAQRDLDGAVLRQRHRPNRASARTSKASAHAGRSSPTNTG